MSHDYYNEVWLVTRSDLEKLLELDRDLQKHKPIKHRENALHHALTLYIRCNNHMNIFREKICSKKISFNLTFLYLLYIHRYRDLVRRLIICYNQMIQTQKRELIKRILDCAIGRMLQCKGEVVKLDCSHFQYIKYILS